MGKITKHMTRLVDLKPHDIRLDCYVDGRMKVWVRAIHLPTGVSVVEPNGLMGSAGRRELIHRLRIAVMLVVGYGTMTLVSGGAGS